MTTSTANNRGLFFMSRPVLPIVPARQSAIFASHVELIIRNLLNELNIDKSCRISKAILHECIQFFLRDIYRIEYQQRDDIALTKFAGYLGFWIRKLKPVSSAFPANKSEDADEIININEILALSISIYIITRELEKNEHQRIFSGALYSPCSDCPGQAECFARYVKRHLAYHNHSNQRYLTYSMRARTFGPHHFVVILENLIQGCCSKRIIELDSVTQTSHR